MKSKRAHRNRKTRRTRSTRKQRKSRCNRRTRHIMTGPCHVMTGGSVLNAPNGSVVIVRDKGDKYSPFIAIDKQEAEREDF